MPEIKRSIRVIALAGLALIAIFAIGPDCTHALHNPRMLYRRSTGVRPSNPTLDPAEFEQYLQVPILLYHEVGEPFSRWEELFVRTQDFEKQMQHLKAEGYNTISMEQLADHWRKDSPLAARPIVIAFDDGYRGNYTNAFSIMQQLDLTATIYVVEGAVGQDNFLTHKMLRDMHEAGFEIGHHTASHRDLTTVSGPQLTEEVINSKRRLEHELDIDIQTFAYPAGSYNESVLQSVREAGFCTAVTNRYGPASYRQGLLQLDRISVYRSDGLQGFEKRLKRGPH